MARSELIVRAELSEEGRSLIEKLESAAGFSIPPTADPDSPDLNSLVVVSSNNDSELTALGHRTLERFVKEEVIKQLNVESIAAKALLLLESTADPSHVDNDWLFNWVDKCKLISDDEMQKLWAKILAGEANSPGTYSKRSVSFLGSLDKHDAFRFRNVCSFTWRFAKDYVPLIYNYHDDIYLGGGIDFRSLTHLDDIGLIRFSHVEGYKMNGFPKKARLHYFDEPCVAHFKDETTTLDTGQVFLTDVGKQLAPISGAEPVSGFIDYVFKRWNKAGCNPSRETEKNISQEANTVSE